MIIVERGDSGGKLHARIKKGPFALEQGVDDLDEGLRGATGLAQGVASLGGVAGCEVGGEIGAAKAVDSLFGVADEE